MIRARAALLALGVLCTVPLAAQQQVKSPPVRPLGPVLARSSEPLGAVSTVLTLPGGKVLVNDILHRRIVMFDSTLTQVTVVADSTSATANAYGARGGGLLSFGGDSALFIDPASLSMMGIDANGALTTVRAVPRATEINLLVGGPNGRPGFDALGRMIYRGQARQRPRAATRGGEGTFEMTVQPDSAPIVRVNLLTRRIDTIAMIKIPRTAVQVTRGSDGRMNVQTTINPLPTTDDWALMHDGSVAVVRGHDFHVDWIDAEGTVTSSPKILFEWVRLSDEDKETIVDSAKKAVERQRAAATRLVGGGGGRGGGRGGAGGEGAPPQRGGGPGGPGGPEGFQPPTINMIPARELPDYRPPFGLQSALGDLDGLLWIRSSASVGDAGPIYYVINRQNEVVDRIQLPQGRMVAGFGKDGIVFMAFRDTEGNNRVESARWK